MTSIIKQKLNGILNNEVHCSLFIMKCGMTLLFLFEKDRIIIWRLCFLKRLQNINQKSNEFLGACIVHLKISRKPNKIAENLLK